MGQYAPETQRQAGYSAEAGLLHNSAWEQSKKCVTAALTQDCYTAVFGLARRNALAIAAYMIQPGDSSLEILRRDGSIPVEERVVTMRELEQADEVWLTSSSKEIAPVIEIDGRPVGDGKVGDVWLAAQTLYSAHKFDF